MKTLFRRAALASWIAILLLVIVVGAFGARAVPATKLHVVPLDRGSDLAIERAAAIPVLTPDAAATPAAVPAVSAAPDVPVIPGATAYAGPTGPRPPGRLVVPRIGVNAQVLGVGLARDGSMAVTRQSYTVGWYALGPAPGDPGDAVITGHLDWYDTSHAVFFNLRTMRAGDLIEVQRLDGATKHFRVTSVSTVSYNATVPGLFSGGGPPRLTLITCGGSWDSRRGQYRQRVIVDAALVG